LRKKDPSRRRIYARGSVLSAFYCPSLVTEKLAQLCVSRFFSFIAPSSSYVLSKPAVYFENGIANIFPIWGNETLNAAGQIEKSDYVQTKKQMRFHIP
jgi:hypothetical protein